MSFSCNLSHCLNRLNHTQKFDPKPIIPSQQQDGGIGKVPGFSNFHVPHFVVVVVVVESTTARVLFQEKKTLFFQNKKSEPETGRIQRGVYISFGERTSTLLFFLFI